MIKVLTRYLASFSATTGTKEEILSVPKGTTLRDFLKKIAEKHGQALKEQLFDAQTGEIKPRVSVLVNGRGINQLEKKLDTKLSDEDSVILTVPISGG